jgi:hypothetical protein
MRTARRPFALLAAAALLFAAGCGSNKERIVGKWKVESTPKGDAQLGGKGFMYMDFAKDGTCKMGVELTDPEAKKKAGAIAEFSANGKYTVTDDKLEILPGDDKKGGGFKKDEGAFTMKFDGSDKLTLTNKDGDAKLSRMK